MRLYETNLDECSRLGQDRIHDKKYGHEAIDMSTSSRIVACVLKGKAQNGKRIKRLKQRKQVLAR